jgi:two-component system, cell cycle sensor histidine kinase and response regulator CckA
MPPVFSTRFRYLYLPSLFLAICLATSWAYVAQDTARNRQHFKLHAAIVADDTWALNRSGAKAYLQLAANSENYQFLGISIPGDAFFLRVTGPPLTGSSRLLHSLGLIGERQLMEEIRYNSAIIGTLYGHQYVQVIFPLFNILTLLLLAVVTLVFTLYLFLNRRYLEQQVVERTRNLRESERRFHDLVDLLPEMVLETDLDGIILYGNSAAREQLRRCSGQGQEHFTAFIIEQERAQAVEHFRFSLRDDNAGLKEFQAIDAQGRTFPILLRAAPIRKVEEVVGARMIAVDITERHRFEEQLLRDQKMKAIGLMAGGVAHDLNNILSGIISYPELLLLDLDENHRMRRPLEAIRRAGLDAADVVADLLTVARGIAATKEVVSVNSLISDYLSSPDFQHLQRHHTLVIVSSTLADDLWTICCSPIHIRKCLMNLVTNGMEAIHGKGSLSIRTENYQQHVVATDHNRPALDQGRYVKISVADSGSGIAPHEIDHIFEPFYTKKVMGRSGTGLGLAVVWNTVRDHGGTITVKSSPQGTIFDLYLPAVHEESTVAASLDWRAFTGNGETVLVIDDELRQREIAAQLLTSLNYHVDTVASGEEAVVYLTNHKVDMLVLDMIMSPGQNGRVTYEQILRMHPGQKALVASGFAEDDDVRACLDMGAGAYVAKPYTLEKISVALYKTLYG